MLSLSGADRGVRDLVTLCFEMVGRPVVWRGEGLQEEGALAAWMLTNVFLSGEHTYPQNIGISLVNTGFD